MGGSSSAPSPQEDRATSAMLVHNLWTATWRTVDKSRDARKDFVDQSPGWKTVRLYVSSTFDDFALEREMLAKKVFPELRQWCLERNIHFIDCDLKRGMNQEGRSEDHLRLCLQEIARCKEGCQEAPFFLHLSCQKVGWVPKEGEISQQIQQEYGWIEGLSHTEMEVLHAVFRKASPNALFAMRKDEFISAIPKEEQPQFLDSDEMAYNKMLGLRKGIRARFKKEKQLNYSVKYEGQDPDDGKISYGDLESDFAEPVLEYFMKRIEITFPSSTDSEGFNTNEKVSQNGFASHTASEIKGYEEVTAQLFQHCEDTNSNRLILIMGNRGSGKSAIMAYFNHTLQTSDKTVFYHNMAVESSPHPTRYLLHKLFHELNLEFDDSSTLDELCKSAHHGLSDPNTQKCILLIDGIEHLQDDPSLSWLPRSLPKNVSCVVCVDDNSVQYKSLQTPDNGAPPAVTVVNVPEVTDRVKQSIIAQAAKEAHVDIGWGERDALIEHPGSNNPQWICVACRELAAGGQVTVSANSIDQLPPALDSLCTSVLDRLEQEMGRALPEACLCLLYLSNCGLRETQILALLADEENLLPRRRKGTGEFQRPEVDVMDRMLAYRWAALYRALNPYLLHCPLSGRLRLRFAAIGDAVMKRYLFIPDDDESWENQGQREDTEKINWWRAKLAYFQGD